MINTLSKGKVKVGKLYGNVAASAGSISSTEIAIADTKVLIGSTAGLSVAYALSGDVTMSNAGVVTIGAKKVAATKMSLANTKIPIGSTASGGVAYALSGDITMSNAGVTAIGAKKVLASMTAIANTKVLIGSTAGAGTAYALSGDVTMTNLGAVTIGTSKVTAGKIGAKAVTSVKVSKTWSTLSNTTKSVTSVALPAALGGYLVTDVGSSLGIVLTSAKLSNPVAGDFYKIVLAAQAPTSTSPTCLKSTAATFDVAGNKVVQMTADNQYVQIEALSTIRWIIVARSTGISLSSST